MGCHLVLMTGPVLKQRPIPMLCLLFLEHFEDIGYLRAGDEPHPLSQLRLLVEFTKPEVVDLAFPLKGCS